MESKRENFGAILASGEADEPLEAWTPEEFDHFTDIGLLRRDFSPDVD